MKATFTSHEEHYDIIEPDVTGVIPREVKHIMIKYNADRNPVSVFYSSSYRLTGVADFRKLQENSDRIGALSPTTPKGIERVVKLLSGAK